MHGWCISWALESIKVVTSLYILDDVPQPLPTRLCAVSLRSFELSLRGFAVLEAQLCRPVLQANADSITYLHLPFSSMTYSEDDSLRSLWLPNLASLSIDAVQMEETFAFVRAIVRNHASQLTALRVKSSSTCHDFDITLPRLRMLQFLECNWICLRRLRLLCPALTDLSSYALLEFDVGPSEHAEKPNAEDVAYLSRCIRHLDALRASEIQYLRFSRLEGLKCCKSDYDACAAAASFFGALTSLYLTAYMDVSVLPATALALCQLAVHCYDIRPFSQCFPNVHMLCVSAVYIEDEVALLDSISTCFPALRTLGLHFRKCGPDRVKLLAGRLTEWLKRMQSRGLETLYASVELYEALLEAGAGRGVIPWTKLMRGNHWWVLMLPPLPGAI